jgi:hypothetical protein
MPQEEKKTFISRNTVLLQGGGRTNIEYSAGPNINITNDVISGKDWSQDIDDAVNSATSGKADVSAIPTVVDYSAGDNINITDHVVSGKDWTQDIVDTVESAISANQPQEYSAGSNINIENHIISGKDWSNELDQKLDTSAFQETISSFATKYELSSTSSEIIDIISATSGQGGGSCPWISGGKDYGSATVQLNFGDVIPVFSSWGLSADHNHYIWMKGAYIRLPDGSEFLPISSFSGYTASMAANISSNWNYTNSAYSMAISNTYNKLDNSAFSAYTAAHSADDNTPYSGANGIEVNDHVISFTGEAGSNYSAGDNINITNNVISGKDWNGEISAASSILNQMIASGDNVAYSAGNNIDVTNHVISGKDWTNEIASSISGKLDSSWTAGKDVTPYSGASGIQVQNHVISITGDVGKTYSAGDNIDITNDVISGRDWTNTIDEHINSAISSIDIPSAKMVSGTSGIKVEETVDRVIFSISGSPNIPSAIKPLSGTSGISVYETPDRVMVAYTAEIPTGDPGKVYSGISPIQVDNVNNTIGLELPGWTLCAGPNINISADEMNRDLYVSAGGKVSYWYNTPVTGISSEGDLLISRNVAASTPDKIRVQVGTSDVGLLVPTNTGHNSMLVTNAMGSVQWEAQSALIPSAVEQVHKVRVYSNDATYSGENALNDYPATDHDWEFTIINQYATSSNWLYYSAGDGTATLYPGKGVRVYYCQNTDTLYSEPEFIADFGDDYATVWGDLDGMKLRAVGTSAEASANGILYVVTGGN